jgi:hypothetical protein
MKKQIALISIALLSIVAVGCGSSGSTKTENPTTTTSRSKATTTTTTTFKKSSGEDAYVANMKTIFPKASRSELIDLGETTCEAIDESGSVSATLLKIASDPDWSDMLYEAGFTIGASVEYFCPEYKEEVLRLLK